MSDPSVLAGLDIGGSKVLAVAVELADDGRPRVIEQVRLTTFPGPDGVVDTASRALTALAGRITGRGGRAGGPTEIFSGVGIGIPGLVDAERGAVTHAVNLGVGTGGLALADRLQRRLGERRLELAVTPDARAWLAERGYDPIYGARPLRRLMQTEIDDRLATALLSGRIRDGETVLVDINDDGESLTVGPTPLGHA